MDLESIILELRQERDRLDAAIRALKGAKNVKKVTHYGKRKRVMSAEARAKIAAAARRRWAAAKKQGKATLAA